MYFERKNLLKSLFQFFSLLVFVLLLPQLMLRLLLFTQKALVKKLLHVLMVQSVNHKEFFIINEGFFSSLRQDSTGIWRDTHAETYTVDNANTVTLKVLYSSWLTHVGALHNIEYDMRGEALTIKWFKKLLDAKEGDVTAQLPKGTQTQYVMA